MKVAFLNLNMKGENMNTFVPVAANNCTTPSCVHAAPEGVAVLQTPVPAGWDAP